MALPKQSLPINFSQGLDLKTDPLQVSPGRFLSLENMIFDKGGLLQKRNGYEELTPLPDTSSAFITTFNGNLTAIGTSLNAYSSSSNKWVDKGAVKPLKLKTLPLIRSNTNQSQADSVVAANGLICTVYTDNVPDGLGGTTPEYKYVIANSVTGQNIVSPTLITPTTGTVVNSPRVFLLGNYFMILFGNLISGVNHIQYIAISTVDPTMVNPNVNITSAYTPTSTLSFDGFVANNSLYIAWNASDVSVKLTYIDFTLVQHNTVSFAGEVATIMSVTADTTGNTPVIYASYYDVASHTGYTLAVNQQLTTIFAPVQTIASGTILNLTSVAQNGSCTIIYEVSNNYTYDSSISTHFLDKNTISRSGTVGTPSVLKRSVGLASKAFMLSGVIYVSTIYYSVFQPTYFLIDISSNIVAKLAYSNGGTYYTTGLPNVSVSGSVVQVSYLIKDLIAAVNKTQGAASAAGVYSQTGINLVSYTLGTSGIVTSEIGQNLNMSGGFLWSYDGYSPVEQGFFLYPDNVEASTDTTGGFLAAQNYFYVVTYEWSDNQGNVFRSAGSIPLEADITSSMTATNTITLSIPTLRLTYKLANPVKIVIYRWSTAQQTYYQVTSIESPLLNDPSADSLDFTDTLADDSIIGNNILYTTGGVIENIGAPAIDTMTLWQSRLFLLDAEDKNLIWFSKQVIEATPVELSDLLTIFVPPTTGAQGSTGDITALSALDDKLIIFKKDAINYISGVGPDNTGANNQYTDPIFITSTVGCANQHSIVFQPAGLMFQSDKGIWLLGRDLSTSYIGAAVQDLTINALVQSAVNVPGTNQVRFTLDSGITLVYDYFYGQWATFTNVPAISSTLYNGLHTYLNAHGRVLQESPGSYLDGAHPVVMSFTTSWLNLAGLQGFERAYYFYMLGTYISPHKLSIGIAYDYNPSPSQVTMITPDNYTKPYGSDTLYGGSATYGGSLTSEQWRIFLQRQKCQSFQISLQEIYDPLLGAPAGAGLSISGLNLIFSAKKSYNTLRASRSVG